MTKVSDHNSPSPQSAPEQRRGGCDIRLIRGSQQKGRARNHAWLSCQSVSGPPFGGITRIRFKGSAPKQFGALSATRLPRTFFLAQNKTQLWEVNRCICCTFRHNRWNPRAQCLQPNCQRETIPRLVPVSRSCERSPAILLSVSSRQRQRCRYRIGLSHRRCLRPSPYTC